MIRVVIADDQQLVRAGFRVLLDAEDDVEVVGEAGDGAAALELVRRRAARRRADGHPHARRRRPGGDAGDHATIRTCADVKVLILTTFELDEYVFDALRAGAAGFLVKHTEPAELVRAVHVVAAGESLLSPSVTRRLIAEFTSRPSRGETSPAALAGLTDREREVVALVAQGLSNDEIAAEWVVSPATVRTHVSRAMMKLHARDRAQLVVMAYQSGLVQTS